MIMIWLLSRIDLGLNSPKKLIIIASKGAVAVCNGCSRAGGDIFFSNICFGFGNRSSEKLDVLLLVGRNIFLKYLGWIIFPESRFMQ